MYDREYTGIKIVSLFINLILNGHDLAHVFMGGALYNQFCLNNKTCNQLIHNNIIVCIAGWLWLVNSNL